MLLGKRQRPPMKRTTSMTEFTLDLTFNGEVVANPQSSDPFSGNPLGTTTVSSRNNRRNSVDFTDSAHFLRSCSLCKRRLIPGRDIYMYRGDGAFCSLECQQQQIIQDERKVKCSLASKKEAASISIAT